jgi:GT2 family glycosyltransferase
MSATAERPVVGVVVPTLGQRPDYLVENLESLGAAGPCFVALVRPASVSHIDTELADRVDLIVDDPGTGLAAALNAGIRSLPASVQLATWLGDDDRLTESSLDKASAALLRDRSVLVFGQCQYIDSAGTPIWLQRSGRIMPTVMRFGPQLVPQPGSLFTMDAFNAVGGLDEKLKWAFDLDLFLRLRKHGRFTFVHEPLAEFRWHEGSLSVGSREGSVAEASRVRRQHLGPIGRAVCVVSEPAARWAIATAGKVVSARSRRVGSASAT